MCNLSIINHFCTGETRLKRFEEEGDEQFKEESQSKKSENSQISECVICHSFPVDDISAISSIKQVYNEHFLHKEVCVSYSHGSVKGIYCVTKSENPSHEQCQNLSSIANEFSGATILLHKNTVSGPLRAYVLNEGELRHVEVSISSDDHTANELFIRLSLATSPTFANNKTLENYWSRIGTYNRHFARELPWETYKKPESVESALKTSRELRNEGKFDEAYYLIFKKIESYPTNYKLHMECGRLAIHLFENKPIYAYRRFNKARMFAPDHAHLEIERCINELVEPVDRALDSRMRKIHCLIKRYNAIPRSDPVLNATLKEMYYQSIYETLAIEGNKLTKEQMKQLVEQSRSAGPATKDHNEVHPEYAGILRPFEVTIGNLNPPKWTQVSDLMQSLVNFCNAQSQKLYPVDLAAAAHYQSAAIHGYADGNGRFSRLFQNVLLTRAGFPPLNVTVEDKKTYYDALQRSHSAYHGDYRIFIDYLADQMETSLLKMIDIQKRREGDSRGAVQNMTQFESNINN
ncbi:fic/DOC family domain-containing protein [Ditylenchus destructor]|nr:fic/DOC family domain-containing protein [Ditylenchus destructor]